MQHLVQHRNVMHKDFVVTDRCFQSRIKSGTASHSTPALARRLSSPFARGACQATKPCWRLPSGLRPFKGKPLSKCQVYAAHRTFQSTNNRGQVCRPVCFSNSHLLTLTHSHSDVQLCKTFCEPHSYHERPHIYADNPPKAGLQLALGKDKALAGAEHPKALNALYVIAVALAQALLCRV